MNAMLDRGTPISNRVPRAPLPVRIILVVVAVLFTVACAFAAVNLASLSQYNQATKTLNANIQQAKEQNADLNTLLVSQQQTDAQFDEANALRSVLLPALREAIDGNAELSSTLTTRIQAQVEAQSEAANASDSSAEDQSDADANKSGLTDAQKQQVEELLRNNQTAANDGETTDTSTSKDASSDDSTQNSSDQAKPW